MSETHKIEQEPSYGEMESLFVNNENFDQIEAYINRFNPIKVMRMERMEIRHSAILAWLLNPIETHGLGDRFLKMFLAEALRGQSELNGPTALNILQGDLRDSEIRYEWQNIDIFILSRANNWAFIIENKFHSTQHKGQLKKYIKKVNSIFATQKKQLKIRGIFLTLWDEEPQDSSYVSIKYKSICENLERMLERESGILSSEVLTFLTHYLDILKDAIGMSNELNEMEKLARQLYRDHKKVLDFVIEHGAGTDFANSVHSLIGENTEYFQKFTIGGQKFVFDGLANNYVSFLPYSWYKNFSKDKYDWPGCDDWWAGYPLINWIELRIGNDGVKGYLWLFAEVGPISKHDFRKDLIEAIQEKSKSENLNNIGFQKGAKDEGKKYSKFFKNNKIVIEDVNNPDQITEGIEKLLKKFEPEFESIAKVLPDFLNYGIK